MKQIIGIVIPTYNESENILHLLEQIKSINLNCRIIIVDDSPKEENKKLKDRIDNFSTEKLKNITLISNLKKGGRGRAVVTGFEKLLEDKSINYFIEMDSDLSHDPKELPLFVNAARKNNADVVVGSRYLDKSQIIKWPLKRVIPSKIINKLINLWLGINLSDYTNGFRLYNRKAIEFLVSVELKEKGFIALSETIYRLKNKRYKIVEIPIKFTDRQLGKSSAGIKEYMRSILGIVRIRMTSIKKR